MLAYLGAGFVAVYFMAMAWPGLLSGFSQDDLMNMTFALRDGWAKVLGGNVFFFSTQYRPLGALYYLSLYDVFGWNSLPFRIVAFAALAINLLLAYRLTVLLTGFREAGLIATVLIAWHGNFSPLYFGSGNCYDVFAFLFYLATLVYYAKSRSRGLLRVRQLAIIAVLQICALNSKEFAATIPLLLLAYELLYAALPQLRLRWIIDEGRGVLLSTVLSAIYTAGKTLGEQSLVNQTAYAPRLSSDAFLASITVYLNDLTYSVNVYNRTDAIWFVIAIVLGGFIMRNRAMIFGACLTLLAPLPVMLIHPRGLASHYLTSAGLAIWLAALTVQARKAFVSSLRPTSFEIRYSQTAVFTSIAAFLLLYHVPHRAFQIQEWDRQIRPIHEVADSLRRHPEWWRSPDARILILSDPFEEDQFHWATVFISILVSRNPNVKVYRLADMNPKPTSAELANYSVLLDWKPGGFVPVDPASVKLP